MVTVGLQILPWVPEEQLYPVVDEVIKLIADSGVKYEVGPMETVMEGQYDELMEVVKKAQKICVRAGAPRVISVVKIDYKPTGVTMAEKIANYR